MPHFKTKFALNEVVYILNADNHIPEPVIITDIHIHNTVRLHITYSVTYSGVTDSPQKDFREDELGTLIEFKRYYESKHPVIIEQINETNQDFRVGDLPKKELTQEDKDFHSYYPKHLRPWGINEWLD